MTITTINSVDGSSWLTSGAVSTGNLGLTISGGDGFVAGAGTFTAWDSGDVKTTRPHWSSSASYVVWSNSFSSKGAFEFCSYSAASSYLALAGSGVETTMGVQFRLTSFAEDTTPAHNSTRYLTSTTDVGGSGDLPFQVKMLFYNVEGFKPGILLSFYGQSSASASLADVPGGGDSSRPMAHMELDRWYLVRQRYQPPSGVDAKDGQYYLWINDVLVLKSTNIDGDFNNFGYSGSFLAALYQFGSSLTGVSLCTCGPIAAKAVPNADMYANGITRPWTRNTTAGKDLRRRWHPYFVGAGTPWTTSGSLSLPASKTGTRYSTGGTYCGKSYCPISATSGNSITFTTPNIWDGNAEDTPFDSTSGLCHVSFDDAMVAASSTATGTIYASDNTTALITWSLNANTGIFAVNGSTVYSSLSDSIRWQVVVTLGGGVATVWLHDQTADTKTATMIRNAEYACSYVDGDAIGKATVQLTGGATETVHMGGISVHSQLTIAVGDSYTSADAGSTPAFQCTGQRLGMYWNCGQDGTFADSYEPVPYAGGIAGVCIGLNEARSGAKLSETIAYILPQITAARGVRWLMMAYDVNDIPASGSVTTIAAAWAAAEVIAERKITFAQWVIDHGHKAIISDAFNLRDTGAIFNGTANYFRRKVPAMVSRILDVRLRELVGTEGVITFVPSAALIDGNADVISTDGVHGQLAYERQTVRGIHDTAANLASLPGFESDGTVSPATAGRIGFGGGS